MELSAQPSDQTSNYVSIDKAGTISWIPKVWTVESQLDPLNAELALGYEEGAKHISMG